VSPHYKTREVTGETLSVGSLFSGIGGLELGLEMTGRFRTVWQVEQSAWCRGRLAEHWPHAKRFEDVRDVGEKNLSRVDVICGGYPCQPFSIAGLMQGTADERHLWPEFARILRELRPRYAILENVPNHLAIGFGEVLSDLAAIGYDAEWEVLSAGALGAHHLRRRIFVLAYLPDSFRSRSQRVRPPTKGPWSREQLEGLVQAAIRISLPAGKSGGISDGLPDRSHRLKALGNAVVPQCARVVGEWLLEIDAELRGAA
jgi:DNA (cytosine-5)-methyltransferase 1